jgi:hypothetical protein
LEVSAKKKPEELATIMSETVEPKLLLGNKKFVEEEPKKTLGSLPCEIISEIAEQEVGGKTLKILLPLINADSNIFRQ